MREPDQTAATEDDRTHRAAEYALGVIEADAYAAAAAQYRDDPAFATEVADWQQLLAPLAVATASVEPSSDVWRRIDDAIGAERGRSIATDRAPRLWQSLAFWRGFAFGSLALAAASLAAIAVLVPKETTVDQVVVAAQPGGPAGIIAAFNPQAGKLLIVPAAPSASQQWVPELWLILPSGAPRSLGVVNPEQPTEVQVPADLASQIDHSPTLTISLEPPGGSPTGRPSGPVIAEGTLHRL